MDNLLLVFFATICQISIPISGATIVSIQKEQAECVSYFIECFNETPEKDQYEISDIVKMCIEERK